MVGDLQMGLRETVQTPEAPLRLTIRCLQLHSVSASGSHDALSCTPSRLTASTLHV